LTETWLEKLTKGGHVRTVNLENKIAGAWNSLVVARYYESQVQGGAIDPEKEPDYLSHQATKTSVLVSSA
jgi:hypothetical protein